MDLVNGRVDAVVIDSNPAAEYVQNNEGLVALESGLKKKNTPSLLRRATRSFSRKSTQLFRA